MGDMQVVVDGINLDRTSEGSAGERWRFLTGTFGDDAGQDNRRVLVAEFRIEAADSHTLQLRKEQTRRDFTKTNCRVTFTLDDDATSFFADVAPNDGEHTDVWTTIGTAPGHEQTGHAAYMRLYVVAGITPRNAGGAPGSVETFQGLLGNLRKTTTYSAARTKLISVLATFVATFDDDGGGTFTNDSVADVGGKAVFHVTTAPPTFSAGMRLKVTTNVSGHNYTGIHLVTAINVGAKTITTDTAYAGTGAGAAQLGTITTGKDNYIAARADLLTDYLLCEDDGAIDPATGMGLTTEVPEDSDPTGMQYGIILQSGFSDPILANVPEARLVTLRLGQEEPSKWNTKFGPKPLYIIAEGSISVDMEALNGSLFQVWERVAKADVEAAITDETGEAPLKPLVPVFRSNRTSGVLEFTVRYQARNQTTLEASYTESDQQEDDAISIRTVTGKDYVQRPPGLPPKSAVRGVTRVGIGKVNLRTYINAPGGEFGATYRESKPAQTAEGPFSTPFGDNVWVQTLTIGYVRETLEGGAGGAGGSGQAFIDGYMTPTGPDV